MNFISKFFVRRKVKGWEKENMDKIKKVVDWFNAKPGRKRGIAAAVFAIAGLLKGLGNVEAAGAVEQLYPTIMSAIDGTLTVSGFVFTVLGFFDAKKKGNL